ncbi:MAG: hypothetical protein SGILL_001101 [Bacillariaceae sp.]
MSKRSGMTGLAGLMNKKSKLDEKTASNRPNKNSGGNGLNNPFLVKPIQPDKTLQNFLTQVRKSARRYLPNGTKIPITKPFCEVEARLGILKVNNRRVTSSGPKRINGTVVQAFDASSLKVDAAMVSGISRSHYVSWTQAGLSEVSPLSTSLGVMVKPNTPAKEAIAMIKRDLVETEYIETVFAGYPGERRIAFAGFVDPLYPMPTKPGQEEYKEKLEQADMILPAAKYDLRIGLASEKVSNPNIVNVPPGWTLHRIKRRRSYKRRDQNMAWQIDVTEVTSTAKQNLANKTVVYEIEMELQSWAMLKLVNEENLEKVAIMAKSYAQQLWWIMQHLNPLEETVDVEEYLQDHTNKKAVQLALATCGALKRFMDHPPSTSGPARFDKAPLATPNEPPSAALMNMKFCGCMPVNFSRHNIEDIQNSAENGYFLSEKTDGVRHLMVFTGETVVLVDRAMRGKQPIPAHGKSEDPMAPVLSLIQPGTVFDGEVVMHRGGSKHKARPLFIVFDVLTINASTAILHLPFEKRLDHLKKATFRTKTANRDMFADAAVGDPAIIMPLVRKNFVHRTQIGKLLNNVVEEKGFRSYRSLPLHNHLTDGIIFQPNLPYVCGTDVNLLKWKYLDTVTIDVELVEGGYQQRNRRGGDEDALNTGVMGPDQTSVDMSRYVKLPASERFRLEADKSESGARIAEVGFDPLSGEWYYLTMRPDKVAPNHISTVLGTLLELSESLTTEELQYRMSVPPGQRDTYRKEFKGMMKQLLVHQQKKHEQMKR